jgi:hypothetical protein
MRRTGTHSLARIVGANAIALLIVLACHVASEARTMALPLANQGYVFMHPFFKARQWKASLERLDLALPDTMSNVKPVGFDVAQGRDSAMAVFSTSAGDLFIMAARYQPLIAPCYDNSLQFDVPHKVNLNGFFLPTDHRFYVVKDTLYSFDSLRVAFASASNALKLYVVTIRASTMAVSRVDSITLAQRRAGQGTVAINGSDDAGTGQDQGIWATGTNGLIRYVSYTNRRWGAEAVRDIGATTPTVTFAGPQYAATLTGRIYQINGTGTGFDSVALAPSPVWRVYNQGAIGNAGLFMENFNGTWSATKQFGSSNFRYGNFIRRSGGLGVELLDSAWVYSAFTYRDSSSRIVSATPAQLMTNINGNAYSYVNGHLQVDITLTLYDLDSNYSDYKLTLLPGNINLKVAGNYTISPIPDSETCHIGGVKMSSGRVRLTLSHTGVKVLHDCVLGALNPTCLTCYWKKTDSLCNKYWAKGSSLIVETSTQRLSIANIDTVRNSTSAMAPNSYPDEISLKSRSNGDFIALTLPAKLGSRTIAVSLHDLQGRLLASADANGRRTLIFSHVTHGTVLVVCCRMSDGSTIRQKVPIVK